MKRLVFTIALAASLIGFSSFKNQDDSVAPAALKSFNKSFSSATDVSWSVAPNFYKASFALNGQYVIAYYDVEGQMIGLTRNISSTQLPICLQADVKNRYKDYWISELFEMANEEGTSYYITLENADTKLILKSTNASDWNTFQKQRKS